MLRAISGVFLRSWFTLAFLVLCATSTRPALAQCDPQWLPTGGCPGVFDVNNAAVRAAETWDPDGSGPLGPVVVLGGLFRIAGTTIANHIATHDPSSGEWSSLGSGMDGSVGALAVLPNGNLVAAGAFQMAGGVPSNFIARWDGIAWHPLGSGLSHAATSLAVMPNGDLFVGGEFTTAGGVAANHVARWDGVAWHPLGAGITSTTWNATVHAVLALANGDLVVGGLFDTAGGIAANHVARWDGVAWSSLGSGTSGGNQSPAVQSLAQMTNGDIVIGGSFATAGGITANAIARWNGSAWFALSSGCPIQVLAPNNMRLRVLTNGHLIAGGIFNGVSGVSANNIARWTGSAWQGLGGGVITTPGYSWCLAVTQWTNGDLIVGGLFNTAGTVPAMNVARYSGTTWSRIGTGLNSRVLSAAVTATGDVVACGAFTTAGSLNARFISRWTGSAWLPLGTGLGGTGVSTYVRRNGDVIASGNFMQAGGIPATGIARFNGAAWQAMGTGFQGVAQSYLEQPNGDLLVGGQLTVTGVASGLVRWTGTTWQPFASSLPIVPRAMVTMPNGDIIAGGDFSFSWFPYVYERVARWDGSAWRPLGAGLTIGSASGTLVKALAVLPNGHVVAGGSFTRSGSLTVNRIARWDGAAWHPLGTGLDDIVNALLVLPNGDLLAGGTFRNAGGVAADYVARWDGSAWHAVDGGLDGAVECLVQRPNGEVLAGGWFTSSTDTVTPYLTRLTPSCPALATPFGSNCTSSTGPMNLTATALPWVGNTFRASCTGMAPGGLACALLGFGSPATPLALLHPTGVSGCDLLASADAVALLIPTSSVVASSFAMPLDPLFAGYQLEHQVLQLELDAGSTITRLAGSNGITLVIGAL